MHGFGLGQVITALNLRAGAESELRQVAAFVWECDVERGCYLRAAGDLGGTGRGGGLGGWLLGLALLFPGGVALEAYGGIRPKRVTRICQTSPAGAGTTVAVVAIVRRADVSIRQGGVMPVGLGDDVRAACRVVARCSRAR